MIWVSVKWPPTFGKDREKRPEHVVVGSKQAGDRQLLWNGEGSPAGLEGFDSRGAAE